LSAPLVNLAAVPLTGIVVPLGFLTLACGLVFTATGKLLAVPLAWLTSLLLRIVQWFAHFPRWSYRIPGPPLWLIVLFFAVGILLGAEMRLKHPLHKTMVWGLRGGFVACALTIAIYPFGERLTKGKLELTALDVGQGDSLLVVTPGGKTLLIDGGGAFGGFPGQEEHNAVDPGEEAVSPYLWSRGFQKLDVVALTHAHQDHLGGLTAILGNFRVARLWIGREVSVPALVKLEELGREQKISIEHELPGDAEKQVEREILSENGPEAMRADVLKIGHHGSKNSTTPEFLAAVQPRVGIISAGEDNPYGHPSPELLERLENAGIRILRTDRNGAVQVMTDGRQLEISCFVACPNGGNAAASVQGKAPDRKQD